MARRTPQHTQVRSQTESARRPVGKGSVRCACTNLVIGAPAAVLAAISGGTGLADTGYRTFAAVLALIALGPGAVVTTLNAAGRADRAHSSATYLGIQMEARQLRNIDLPGMEAGHCTTGARQPDGSTTRTNVSADIPTPGGRTRPGERAAPNREAQARNPRQDGGLGPRNGFRDGERLRESRVPHSARRSRISRSRSVRSRSLSMNSASSFTRAISAMRASMTRALTLTPRPRATTSAVAASSSGSRTVVVFRATPSRYYAIICSA